MQREDKQRYGALDKYFSETKEALKRCDRSYPSSSQIYNYLDEDTREEVPATTFGWAVSALNDLGAFELWNDDVHDTNRYNLTTLDEDYLDSIEEILDQELS